MMPCVAKEASDHLMNGPSVPSVPVVADKPKNIYKPKYHAFSIESLVGNNDNKNSNNNNNETNDENESTDVKHKKQRVTPPTPTTAPPSPPQTPDGPSQPLNGHKVLNGDDSDKSDEYVDYGSVRSPKMMGKNGILRSYMTTHNQNHVIHNNNHNNNTNNTSHANNHLDFIAFAHNSDRNNAENHTILTNHNVITHTNRYNDNLHSNHNNNNNHLKYDHILNLRSNINTQNIHNNHNSSPILRNISGPVVDMRGAAGVGPSSTSPLSSIAAAAGPPALQSSPFASSQYYCNQLYCRPFDDRLIQGNHFMPQVCDYKMLSSKSPDICCQPSFNGYRKPKRIRTAFSPGQLLRLEEIFERNRYVVGCERKQLARDLNLSETQIKVWFQNRRTKHKREKHQQNGSGKRSSTVSALIHGYSPNGLSLNGGQYSDNDVDDDDEEDFVH